MNTNIKNLFYYFVSISIGATAFQVFSEGLKDLHWAYAGFLFSITSWLSVTFLHSITVTVLQKSIKLEDEKVGNDKKWLELSRSEFYSILFLGILSFCNFALMLPFLKNQSTAIYFTIIGSALVRIIAITIAQKLFNDKIGNKFLFWLGFIICIAGVFLFKYSDFLKGNINYGVILVSILWGCLSVISAQAQRFITIGFSERKIKIPYLSETLLSIKTQQEKSEFIKMVLFFITACICYSVNQFSFVLPNKREILSALWIGYAVTVFGGTISLGLKNKIGETAGSILQSLRVISAMVYAPIIAYLFMNDNPTEIWTDYWKWVAVSIITVGSLLGLALGKPSKGKL